MANLDERGIEGNRSKRLSGYGASSWADLERLVSNAVPEAAALEYKRELSIGPRAERIETLKDLSGMGNGGGGTIIYGIDERDDGVAAAVTPLSDLTDVGRLEDLVRASVRPPLLWNFDVVQGARGFVLVVEVQRSPLGPYMVEAYDQRRYFVRIGRSTLPMSEQQVRDAYLLAARGREERSTAWKSRDLPMIPSYLAPWLVTSALPVEPLEELFDPAVLAPAGLAPPRWMQTQAESADLNDAVSRGSIWAEGIFGEERYGDTRPPHSIVRIHRDGAAAFAVLLREAIASTTILRPLHAHLLYLGWLWETIGLRSPAEVDLRLLHPTMTKMTFGYIEEEKELNVPDGVEIDAIGFRREVLPGELRRAAARHRLVREMADRVQQAYGFRRADIAVMLGWLYGREGRLLGYSYYGRGLWDARGQMVAVAYENGRIDHLTKGFPIGFLREGVFLDPQGRTIGLLEFGTGSGVPDDFVHQEFARDPRPRIAQGSAGEAQADPQNSPAPDSLGEWSDVDLAERLRPEAEEEASS